MKKEVVIEKKGFNKSDSEVIEYVAISLVLEGQVIRLEVKKEDKKLFNYLVDKELSKVGGNK